MPNASAPFRHSNGSSGLFDKQFLVARGGVWGEQGLEEERGVEEGR